MSTKKRIAALDSIQYFFFMIFVRLIRACSLDSAYAISRFAGTLFYLVDFRHRSRAVRHILHSGIRTTRKEAKILARANMIHMVKVFVEIIKFQQIVTPENISEYISVADNPTARKYFSKEGSSQMILTSGHIGNWELAGGAYTCFTGQKMTSIMRPLGNEKIGEFFYKMRSSFQHKTSSKKNGLRPLFLAHANGETITIVSDQHASHKEGVEVTFFGHPARAHATPALFHLKTGTPIFVACLVRVGDRFHFQFDCSEPFVYNPPEGEDKETSIRNICQKYTDNLEAAIRKYPDQWLWAHRRWLDIERGHDDEFRDGKRIAPPHGREEK